MDRDRLVLWGCGCMSGRGRGGGQVVKRVVLKGLAVGVGGCFERGG